MKEIINGDWLNCHVKDYYLFTLEFNRNFEPAMYGYKRRTQVQRAAVMELEVYANYTYWFRDGVITFDKELLNHYGMDDVKKVIELNCKAGWIELLEEDDQTYTIRLNKEKIERDLNVPGYFKSLYDEMDRQGFKRK